MPCLSGTETTPNLSFPQHNSQNSGQDLFPLFPILINNFFHQITRFPPPWAVFPEASLFIVLHIQSTIFFLNRSQLPCPSSHKRCHSSLSSSCAFSSNHCVFLLAPVHLSQHRTLWNVWHLIPPGGLKLPDRFSSHKLGRSSPHSDWPLRLYILNHFSWVICYHLTFAYTPTLVSGLTLKYTALQSLKASVSKFHRLAGLWTAYIYSLEFLKLDDIQGWPHGLVLVGTLFQVADSQLHLLRCGKKALWSAL